MFLLLCLVLALPAVYAQSSVPARPCQLGDYRCIGGYLGANSQCNPQVRGSMPSQYVVSSFPFETPNFNLSNIDSNLNISNHNNCGVTQFFYSSTTNTWVLSITCQGLKLQSTRTLIYRIPEREDEYYSVDYSGVYPKVILTVNLRPANYVNLCTTPAFAYVSALPNFQFTARDARSRDFISRLGLSEINVYVREAFSYRANLLLRYFVNSLLCNFGCDF